MSESTNNGSAARSHDFVAKLTVPEARLREEYDALVLDGYAESWDAYLAEQQESFVEYASGWWYAGEPS